MTIYRKKYIFIDESQRLTKENINFIKTKINKNTIFFLFGDENQKIGKNDYGYKELIIDEKEKNNLIKLNKTHRFSLNNLETIKFIFNFTNQKPKENNKTFIEIYNDINLFYSNFKNDNDWKVMASIEGTNYSLRDQILINLGIQQAPKDLYNRPLFLYNDDYLNNYYFFLMI